MHDNPIEVIGALQELSAHSRMSRIAELTLLRDSTSKRIQYCELECRSGIARSQTLTLFQPRDAKCITTYAVFPSPIDRQAISITRSV